MVILSLGLGAFWRMGKSCCYFALGTMCFCFLDASTRVAFRVGSDGHGSGDLSSDGELGDLVAGCWTPQDGIAGRVRVNSVCAPQAPRSSSRALPTGRFPNKGASVFQHGAQLGHGWTAVEDRLLFCFECSGKGAEEEVSLFDESEDESHVGATV